MAPPQAPTTIRAVKHFQKTKVPVAAKRSMAASSVASSHAADWFDDDSDYHFE